uniref:Uncharacterized protein n=1 Tax=Arundo donax TaxID=35708 RepID=A0A0A9GWH9_ARUDO
MAAASMAMEIWGRDTVVAQVRGRWCGGELYGDWGRTHRTVTL